MIEQFGPPSCFMTLSFADTFSPILERLLNTSDKMRHNAKVNSVIAVKVFLLQLEIFIEQILKDVFKCSYYFIRLEHQSTRIEVQYMLTCSPGIQVQIRATTVSCQAW